MGVIDFWWILWHKNSIPYTRCQIVHSTIIQLQWEKRCLSNIEQGSVCPFSGLMVLVLNVFLIVWENGEYTYCYRWSVLAGELSWQLLCFMIYQCLLILIFICSVTGWPPFCKLYIPNEWFPGWRGLWAYNVAEFCPSECTKKTNTYVHKPYATCHRVKSQHMNTADSVLFALG